jgi:hypothetical protein
MAIGDYSPIISAHVSGRIQPQQWQAPDGSWVLLIGVESAGIDEDIEVGDRFGLQQKVDFSGFVLLRFAARFRQSADTGTVGFRASLLLDGAEVWAEEPAASAVVEYSQRTVNVTDVGIATLEFRLEAVAP